MRREGGGESGSDEGGDVQGRMIKDLRLIASHYLRHVPLITSPCHGLRITSLASRHSNHIPEITSFTSHLPHIASLMSRRVSHSYTTSHITFGTATRASFAHRPRIISMPVTYHNTSYIQNPKDGFRAWLSSRLLATCHVPVSRPLYHVPSYRHVPAGSPGAGPAASLAARPIQVTSLTSRLHVNPHRVPRITSLPCMPKSRLHITSLVSRITSPRSWFLLDLGGSFPFDKVASHVPDHVPDHVPITSRPCPLRVPRSFV